MTNELDRSHRGRRSSPTRPERCPSWASPTPTSPAWWSTTSTPAVGSSAVRSSCSSRTAPPTTRSPRPLPRSSSSDVDVDVVVGGIYSSTRQAIKGPVVDRAQKLYIYPEQYEGQECHPLIFCTGPVPAQQIDPLFPWLMEQTGAQTFYLPSADYIWPHTLNKRGPRGRHRARRRRSSARSTSPSTTWTTTATWTDIMARVRRSCSTPSCRPASRPSSTTLYEAGFPSAEGSSCAPTSTRTSSTSCQPSRSTASTGASTTTKRRRPVQQSSCSTATTAASPAARMFTAGSACTGTYRALKLWEAAVIEAGSLDTRRRRGARPRPDRRRSGWPRRDGARPAPPPVEHVHRPARRAARSR